MDDWYSSRVNWSNWRPQEAAVGLKASLVCWPWRSLGWSESFAIQCLTGSSHKYQSLNSACPDGDKGVGHCAFVRSCALGGVWWHDGAVGALTEVKRRKPGFVSV